MTGNPLLEFNHAVEMPALGLGVFQGRRDETASAVQTAIAAGYRLIDTAAVYLSSARACCRSAIRCSPVSR